ncbi:MAG: hypothetical protein ACREGI_04370 [Candidatus Levyibacteriota bacterium]
MKSKLFWVLALVVLLGSYFRLQGVFTNSFAFTYDVGRDMLALQNIVVNHKIPLIGATTGLPGLFYGPWWYYILTIPFLIGQGNPVFIDFFMAFSGIVSIFLAYMLGKKIGGTFLAFIFATFVSLSPVLIGISSQIWNPNLAPLFVIFLMFVWYDIHENKSQHVLRNFFFLGLLLALFLDIEVVFGLLLDLGIFFVFIFLLRSTLKLKNILFILLGFVIIISPRLFFEVRHNFLMTRNLINIIFHSHGSGISVSYFSVFINRFFGLIFLWNETVANGNIIVGVALLILVILALVFLTKKAKNTEKFFFIVGVILTLTFLLGLTFFSHDIWPHYLVGLPVVFVLLLSISLSLFFRSMQRKWILFVLLFLVVFVEINPVRFIGSFFQPLWEGDASVYRNQLAVIDYVYQAARGKQFAEVVYTPPVYDYTYQYLFSWYGKNKYHYVPSTGKTSLFFVILEPDLQYPSRLIDWLKVREHDGTIINQKELKGGIVVQTRKR